MGVCVRKGFVLVIGGELCILIGVLSIFLCNVIFGGDTSRMHLKLWSVGGKFTLLAFSWLRFKMISFLTI